MPYVLRYDVETVAYDPAFSQNRLVDFFIMDGLKITIDPAQALRFCTEGNALAYASQYTYPCPLKTERVI